MFSCWHCQRYQRCNRHLLPSCAYGKSQNSPSESLAIIVLITQIIGGLHLAGPELAYRIKPTADFFSTQMRPSPTYVLPMHCSGFNCKIALQEALGEACVPAGVGMKVTVDGNRLLDERLPPGTWR